MLDLTHNNIKSLSKHIVSVDKWQDNVIELLLPAEAAAYDARYYDSQSPNMSEQDFLSPYAHRSRKPRKIVSQNNLNEAIPSDIISRGFPMLHILNLEGNRLGLSGDNTFWTILAKLPM